MMHQWSQFAGGILSTARINHAVLEPARETDKAEVIAVASRDTARAQRYAHEHGIARAYDCAFDPPAESRVEAIGSKGFVVVSEPFSGPGHLEMNGERIEVEDVDRYLLQLENFSEAIRGVAEPLLGRADAVGQARTIAALYRSAEGRRAVQA